MQGVNVPIVVWLLLIIFNSSELFDTIKDFEDNTYYRHSAHETYNVDYISDFVEVKEFATDRDEVRIAIWT